MAAPAPSPAHHYGRGGTDFAQIPECQACMNAIRQNAGGTPARHHRRHRPGSDLARRERLLGRSGAVRTPITSTLYPHTLGRRPTGVQASGINPPPPAWVQTPHERTVWHTIVARTHESTPPAATVRLQRKRV
jgi:hypothetical protein